MNSTPFGQLKSFIKILIGVQYNAIHAVEPVKTGSFFLDRDDMMEENEI